MLTQDRPPISGVIIPPAKITISPVTKNRITSIDFLKGLVMVIMALDHTRDYFHSAAFIFDPTDPSQTNLPLFFTRWITHFCAPAFSFLAGISAFFAGKRKTLPELSTFLLTRGLWLVLIEFTIVNFGWFFDIQFRTMGMLVIWALGVSMIALAAIIHLPRSVILIFSLLMIFGHNLLDTLHFEGSMWWAILHDGGFFFFQGDYKLFVIYPLVPWIGVMSLGYCFGPLYHSTFDSIKRRKLLTAIGISATLLFFILRYTNVYGNPTGWTHYEDFSKSLVSFLNPSKYPPSLLYLLMTLGPSLIFMAYTENARGRIVNFFCTYGRVPFFYYILHIYLIHLMAMVFAQFSGFGWQGMILSNWVTELPYLKGYGFDLWVVYLVWMVVVLLLYPWCKSFEVYKLSHKEKWWLSYL